MRIESSHRKILFLFLILLMGRPDAAIADDIAYIYADRPTESTYSPDNAQTFLPRSALASITRTTAGVYSVDLSSPLLRDGGNVQITARRDTPGYCNSMGWTPSSVTVGCFGIDGSPVDSAFTLLVTLPGDDANSTYTLVGLESDSVYTATDRMTTPSMRGRLSVRRTGVGVYRVSGTGIAGDGINLQVTAAGRDGRYCIVGSWSADQAKIECFEPGGPRPRGTRADSQFFLLATRSSGSQAAFAWNYDETARSYTVVEKNGRSSDGDPVSISWSAKGHYDVDLGPILDEGGTVQVATRSNMPGVCNVEGWADSTATVRCFDLEGYPAFMEFTILARRVVPRIVVDTGEGGPLPPGPDIPTGGGGDATIIDFDTLPDGTVVDRDILLRFEYRDAGALFPDGVLVHRCGALFPCTTGETTNQAAAPQALTEFRNRYFEVLLTHGRQRLTFFVLADSSASESSPVTATAYDQDGAVIHAVTTPPLRPGTETSVTVRSREADIARVVVTSAVPESNLVHVDTLQLYGDGSPIAIDDSLGPRVRIYEPTIAARIAEPVTQVDIEAGGTDEIVSVDVQLQKMDSGEIVVPYSAGAICGGAGTTCIGRPIRGSIDVPLDEPGHYRVFARACSAAGDCAVARQRFERVFPDRQDVDVWVMGMEYNQDWQDTIYTDLLNDGSEAGRVPLRHPSNRDTELSLPIVAGKPMVVRAYVGLRDGAEVDSVPVTGRLRVTDGTVGGRSWVFSPLHNENCQDHLGNTDGQRCLGAIDVSPTLGDQGFLTNTPYDIDLIQRRIHWEGTLNFVLPAEVTDAAIGAERGGTGLTMNLEVFPVDQWDAMRNPDGIWNEVNSRDNAFQLQLENARREVLRVRLVRVAMLGAPAPSRADARRAIEEVGRVLPFSEIDVDVESEFYYSGTTATIDADFLGFDVIDEDLDQCQVLWLQLYEAYGLNSDAILVGLVPQAIDPCQGLGWAVPNLEILREARGRRLTFVGGIAHSRMPDYSAGDDWGRVAILAMEIMHAYNDARHVSNLHGEDGGCPLTEGAGGALIDFVSDAVGLGVDVSCFKPEVHPHGTIGSYPPTVVRIGRPGDVSGTLLGGTRIFGNLGGFGVRIDPDGASSRLTMYDPCPTGPLDLSDPLAVLRQRIDPSSGYLCDLPGPDDEDDDEFLPHDVMSYGNPARNRWYAIQITPGLKNPNEGL